MNLSTNIDRNDHLFTRVFVDDLYREVIIAIINNNHIEDAMRLRNNLVFQSTIVLLLLLPLFVQNINEPSLSVQCCCVIATTNVLSMNEHVGHSRLICQSIQLILYLRTFTSLIQFDAIN